MYFNHPLSKGWPQGFPCVLRQQILTATYKVDVTGTGLQIGASVSTLLSFKLSPALGPLSTAGAPPAVWCIPGWPDRPRQLSSCEPVPGHHGWGQPAGPGCWAALCGHQIPAFLAQPGLWTHIWRHLCLHDHNQLLHLHSPGTLGGGFCMVDLSHSAVFTRAGEFLILFSADTFPCHGVTSRKEDGPPLSFFSLVPG